MHDVSDEDGNQRGLYVPNSNTGYRKSDRRMEQED